MNCKNLMVMDNIIDDSESSVEQKGKKKVDRSAAYAARTIEDSLKFVGEIYKNFRNAFAKRDDIIDLIEGSHPRHVAAASHYGLLDREKDTYQVTELYKTISVNYLNDNERRLSLLKAFESPSLNRELIDKFDGDEVPQALVAHLSRFHRITEDAAPLAADVFIKNAKYCGVLDDNNVLNFKKTQFSLENPGIKPAQATVEQQEEGNHSSEIAPKVNVENKLIENKEPAAPLLLPEMINEERVKVKLTGKKFAYLIFPLDINKTDVQILKKEIEQLELTIE